MHDPLHWHPYDGDHHHGVNPNAYLDLFGSPLYDFLALHNLPTARPFTGWTDRFGHLVSPTGTPGIDEVPLIISAEVPQGNAMLNRPVKHGDALAAPIMEF